MSRKLDVGGTSSPVCLTRQPRSSSSAREGDRLDNEKSFFSPFPRMCVISLFWRGAGGKFVSTRLNDSRGPPKPAVAGSRAGNTQLGFCISASGAAAEFAAHDAMEVSEQLKCRRPGCGQSFSASSNREDACRHHKLVAPTPAAAAASLPRWREVLAVLRERGVGLGNLHED
ncbi:hypothetical protein cyc_07703 [Cyclospora cayetanensis]|uniref:Uncharacterized protein n=1 Tax=Cyclospora cayetanensis TaxID=88456 RepID=A0A1D3D677_9EIME|nr:hypothetical protein cyc_07703 [Cyclospora cayetanensis]